LNGGKVVKIPRDRIAEAAEILSAASAWSASQASFTWKPADIGCEALAACSDRDELYGLIDRGEIVGCMLLTTEDAVHWPDDKPGDALYVHKLAVKRSRAGMGVGEALVDFASREAKLRGVPMLRLDTVPQTRLPDYYQRQGFIADANGPADYAGRWLIRMEKRIE
jgi:ribosomal protein S18 acetylase RimI-like enzyme